MLTGKLSAQLEHIEREKEEWIGTLEVPARYEHRTDNVLATALLNSWINMAVAHANSIAPFVAKRASEKAQSDERLRQEIEEAVEIDDVDRLNRLNMRSDDERGTHIPQFNRTRDNAVNSCIQHLSVCIARESLIKESVQALYQKQVSATKNLPALLRERIDRRDRLQATIAAITGLTSISKMSTLPNRLRTEIDFARTFILAKHHDVSLRIAKDHPVCGVSEFNKLCELVMKARLPNWTLTTDVLKFMSVAAAMHSDSEGQVLAISCTLSTEVQKSAVNSSKGMKRHLRDRLNRILRRKFSEAETAFVYESRPRIHVHGIIQSKNPAHDRKLIRESLKTWVAGVDAVAAPTDVNIKVAPTPMSWVVYSCKRLGLTGTEIGSNSSLSASNKLRRNGKRAYETLRHIWADQIYVC